MKDAMPYNIPLFFLKILLNLFSLVLYDFTIYEENLSRNSLFIYLFIFELISITYNKHVCGDQISTYLSFFLPLRMMKILLFINLKIKMIAISSF